MGNFVGKTKYYYWDIGGAADGVATSLENGNRI
jgi:hypothetical protein